ncbi:MAG: ribokinase, partial [Flavobacteriaceae bacterium]
MMTTDNKNGKIVKPAGAVVVLGSLHYDVMVETSRRPEKGETVTGKRWYPKFGGKGGNQAVAAKLHGAQVRFVSATGSDNFADYLHERLTQVGISREYVPRIQSVETGMSVAIQDSDGDYGAVIVSGANLAIEPEILSDESLWLDSSILLLQNEVPESLNLIAAKQARYRNIPVCLNAAPVRQMSSDL